MKRKPILVLVLVLTSLGVVLGLMAFTPYGSFNHNEWGFYKALGGGIFWFFMMYFIMRKNF